VEAVRILDSRGKERASQEEMQGYRIRADEGVEEEGGAWSKGGMSREMRDDQRTMPRRCVLCPERHTTARFARGLGDYAERNNSKCLD
jgi:hypothetical protein